MSATNLAENETVVIEGKEKARFIALVDATKQAVIDAGTALAGAESAVKGTSEMVARNWLKEIDLLIGTNGKPDFKSFCLKIYYTFGDILVPKEGKPSDFMSYTTVSKDGYAKHGENSPIVRAANGMKAVENWLTRNVDSICYTEQPVMKDGAPVMDEKTGLPLMERKRDFRTVVTAEEKGLSSFLKTLDNVSTSKLLDKDELSSAPTAYIVNGELMQTVAEGTVGNIIPLYIAEHGFSPWKKAVSARLFPTLEAEAKESKERKAELAKEPVKASVHIPE